MDRPMDWSIDFIGMPNYLGLFYAYKLRKCIYCPLYLHFFVLSSWLHICISHPTTRLPVGREWQSTMLEDGILVTRQSFNLTAKVIRWPATLHFSYYWARRAIWEAWSAGYVKLWPLHGYLNCIFQIALVANKHLKDAWKQWLKFNCIEKKKREDFECLWYDTKLYSMVRLQS